MFFTPVKKFLAGTFKKMNATRHKRLRERRIREYLTGGRVPWSKGYEDYKWEEITAAILDSSVLNIFKSGGPLPAGYGRGIDERIVEYPFVFSRLSGTPSVILDAGSTFNF